MAGRRTQVGQIRWMEFRNDSDEEVPPFGILRITDTKEVDGKGVVLLAEKPDSFGARYTHFINSHLPVRPGDFGECAASFPTMAKYNKSDGEPAFGETWGPVDGEWELQKDVPGFVVMGFPGNGRVLVQQKPMWVCLGKAPSDIAKGATGTVDFYAGDTAGSETKTSHSVEAHARVTDITADKWVYFEPVEGSGADFDVVPAEC